MIISVKCCLTIEKILIYLLEYFEGNRGVLDGNYYPAMVQVQDVMLLLENLKRRNVISFRGEVSD